MDVIHELEEMDVKSPIGYVTQAAKAMGLAPAEEAAPPPRP